MTDNTDDRISLVESLPVEVKTILVEKILSSLSPSTKEIDDLWALEAEKSVGEVVRKGHRDSGI